MSDPVPAITEAAATGGTAAIFADIRQVLSVDVVNLIWRHLATMDGALPWALAGVTSALCRRVSDRAGEGVTPGPDTPPDAPDPGGGLPDAGPAAGRHDCHPRRPVGL